MNYAIQAEMAIGLFVGLHRVPKTQPRCFFGHNFGKRTLIFTIILSL